MYKPNRYVSGFDTYVAFGAYGGVWQVIFGLEILETCGRLFNSNSFLPSTAGSM